MRNRKYINRFKLFFRALLREHICAITENDIPPIYYLLYDEEKIIEWQLESIKTVKKMLEEEYNKKDSLK